MEDKEGLTPVDTVGEYTNLEGCLSSIPARALFFDPDGFGSFKVICTTRQEFKGDRSLVYISNLGELKSTN